MYTIILTGELIMDFSIPQEILDYLDVLDIFFEKKIKEFLKKEL